MPSGHTFFTLSAFVVFVALLSVKNLQAQQTNQAEHPYTGKFRFWVSDVDKAAYSRITYAIDKDSLIIKEGPYDFIYFAKNYPADSVYFKRALNKKEKALLSKIERQIELDSLETTYTNYCIIDGLILTVSFESARFSKVVTLSNYYHENIANVVAFLNRISPKKYRLWYSRKILLKQQPECDLFGAKY